MPLYCILIFLYSHYICIVRYVIIITTWFTLRWLLCNNVSKKRNWLPQRTNPHQPRTVPPSSLRSSTDCLTTETPSSSPPQRRGHHAQLECYRTVWELSHPSVCVVCVWEKAECVYRRNITLRRQTKVPVFAQSRLLPHSLYLAQILFSLREMLTQWNRVKAVVSTPSPAWNTTLCWSQTLRFWLRLHVLTMKHVCMGFLVPIKFECRASDEAAGLVISSGSKRNSGRAERTDLVCPIRLCSQADNLICFLTKLTKCDIDLDIVCVYYYYYYYAGGLLSVLHLF